MVNKSDRPGADRAAAQLRAMLTVGAQHDRARGGRPTPKRPDVMLASALTGAGVAELLAALDRRDVLAPSGSGGRRTRPRSSVPRRRSRASCLSVCGAAAFRCSPSNDRRDPEIGGHARCGSLRRRRFLLRALNGSDPS